MKRHNTDEVNYLIYLDYAATTPLDSEVERAMQPFYQNIFANPSSVHSAGRAAKTAMEEAREGIAKKLHAQAAEIIFTSGGTEADNLAISGVMNANRPRGNHIITSAIEHHAILSCCERLAEEGVRVTYLPPDSDGRVSASQVAEAITPATVLVSVMYANNEIGSVQPIAEIGKLCRERKILFHCDAVQAAGALPLQVDELSIDLLSLSAHKIYGPKGVGLLYVRRGVRLQPLLLGGGQEQQQRAGSENVAGIIGFAKALEIAGDKQETGQITALREQLIDGLLAIPESSLNGSRSNRLAGNANISFSGIPGEALLRALDRVGIFVSTGSACSAGNGQASHVLRAMGQSLPHALEAVRFTLGRATSEADIVQTINDTSNIVKEIRQRRSRSR